MTLTTRLSVFFLAGLAAVLIGFSTALYLIARAAAFREVDRRVDGALDAMTSAVEVKPTGVEWEPDERGFTLSARPADLPVSWGVFDDGANLQATSGDGRAAALLAAFTGREDSSELSDHTDEPGQAWRVRLRRVSAPEPYVARPRPPAPRRKQATVLLIAGVPYSEAHGYLRGVAATLGVTSGAVWVLSAVLARRLCRRALAPVRGMAEASRSLRAADLSSRLPEPATADELADLARSFNNLLDRVQEAFERQRAFTTEASHQFRTPLAGIIAQAAVALRGQRTEEEYRRTLRAVHDRAGDLQSMVEAMLFLARADAETVPPAPRPFDLAAAAAATLARWADRPGGADLRLRTPTGRVGALAHPPFLAPLLDNLFDNALKYRFPGTPVTVVVERVGGGVALHVADHGPGISAADRPRLFEPFFRTHDAQLRGIPGSGLGLAIAGRLARALGGTLSVESEPGRGARFTLVLPEATIPEE